MALKSNTLVVVVAGYAMRQMCKDDLHNHAFVVRLIKKWIDSGDPNLLWAAGAALWRVYPAFAAEDERSKYGVDELHELLTGLAVRFDQFNERRQLALIEAIFSEEIPESDAPIQTLSDLWQALTTLKDVRKKVENQIEEWKASIYVSMLRGILEIAKHHPIAVVTLLREWLDRPNEASLSNEPENEDLDEERSARVAAEDPKRRAVAQYLTRDLFAHNSKADRLIKERHEPLLGLIEPILDADQAVVDRVLDVVLGWTENEAWHSSIETCLIHASNRALHGQRERLCRHLAYQWVRTERSAVRDLAERVLARALLLNGFPSDLPRGGQGVLLVDGGWQGRSSQSAARIGHQLYERLRARIDLRVGVLGSGLVDCATHAVIQDSFELDHATPRLLFPILEHLDPEQTPFVLVLIWEDILDLEDALASPWEGRLILIPFFGTQFPDHPLFYHEVQASTEAAIRPIDLLVGRSMGYRLVRRCTSEWDALMAVSFPEVRPLTEDRLGEELERLATTLDERASAAASPDHTRLITSGVQWLAGRDMGRAVALLEDWMRRDEYWPILGEATAVMLLRSYKEWNLHLGENDIQHRPPPEDVLAYVPLLRLGPALAECESWRGIETLFQLVRCWAVAPHWSERFRLRQPNIANELLATLDGVPRHWSTRLFRLFQAWEKPLAEIGEDEDKAVSEGVRLLQQWLLLRLRLGSGSDTKLATDGEYGLIVLDPEQGPTQATLFLAKVAIEVFKELDKKRTDPLQLLLYRLGDAHPVAVSKERPSLDLLVPEAKVPAPRLLMPLTERLLRERLRFRLLLGQTPPLDIDDDTETAPPSSLALSVGKQQRRVPQWPKHWQQHTASTKHVKSEVARLVKLITPLLIQEPQARASD